MTDDLFVPLTPPNPAASPSRCRRHLWDQGKCARCDRPQNLDLSRRGRNNRTRGNRAELDVARSIGGRKVGPLGMPHDVEIAGYMRLQVKKLARWPSLNEIVVMLDAMFPGRDMRGVALVQPGRGGRRLIVLDLDEFARWHGDPTKGGAA